MHVQEISSGQSHEFSRQAMFCWTSSRAALSVQLRCMCFGMISRNLSVSCTVPTFGQFAQKLRAVILWELGGCRHVDKKTQVYI